MTPPSSNRSPRTAGCGTSIIKALLPLACCAALSGCFFVAVGAGAGEAGYVAGQKNRSAGETMSDQWIFTKVSTKIADETGITSRHVSVSVDKGVVTLSGVVYSRKERNLAVALAKDTDGVKQVVDRLSVP